MNINNFGIAEGRSNTAIDSWINYKFNETVIKVNKAFDDYRLDLATKAIYEFIWYEFCDWFIELNKINLNEDIPNKPEIVKSMVDILEKTLRLAHPIMPFITEEIWNQFKQHHGSDESSLMISDYPVQIENVSESDFLTIEWLKEAVTGIRNIRGELSIKPSTKISAIFKGGVSKDKESLEKVSNYMMELSGFKNILWADEDEEDPPSSILAIKKLRILIPLEGLIDANEEEQRLNKKISKLEQEKDMLGKKLNNKKFVDNAPKDLVLNQQDRYTILETELNNLKNQLIEIQKLI